MSEQVAEQAAAHHQAHAPKVAVVTGGGGFIGAYLTRYLVSLGWEVRVIDNLFRGQLGRLEPVKEQIKLYEADVRDEDALTEAFKGAEVVFHLAAINGTDNFYRHPELVLDVGIRGALAVAQACQRANVPDVVYASSAEVYQTPSVVPTDEDIPLTLPNSLNPRYSYGGSKIISELIAFNYGQAHFRKVQVFRPHNIYGPDMGWKHVIPQLIERLAAAKAHASTNAVQLTLQGDGSETRAFCFVDDVVEGIVRMYERGEHREVYHIGNDEEVSIAQLALELGAQMGLEVELIASEAAEGGTPRRCPSIQKMRALGYEPQVSLREGVSKTLAWYLAHQEARAEQLEANGLL